jgi:hypothetical protein
MQTLYFPKGAKRGMTLEEAEAFQKAQKKKERPKEVKKIKPKKIDFYKLARDVRKDAEKRREYERDLRDIRRQERQDRYSKTRSGKLGSKVSKIFGVARRGVTQSLYSQGMTTQQKIELAKRFKSQAQKQIIIQRPNPEQQFFNSVFSIGDIMAVKTSREVFNSAKGINESNLGDRTAFQLGREAFGHSNIGMGFGNVFNQIENEVWLNSKFSHTRPVRKIKNEANFWANIIP